MNLSLLFRGAMALLLAAVFSAAQALVFIPPRFSLEDFHTLNTHGLREITEEETLWVQKNTLEQETVADYMRLFGDDAKTDPRFKDLNPSTPAAEVFHLGEPLFIDSLFDREDPSPETEWIDRWLTSQAKDTLREWGIDPGNADYERWLAELKLWYWRLELVEAGPAYLVPVVNDENECVALSVNYAWELPGGLAGTLRRCRADWPYLNQSDARRVLESEGFTPARPLRALRSFDADGPFVVPKNCYGDEDLAFDDVGFWTDGVHAVGVTSGTVYKVSPNLAGDVEHVYPPAEPRSPSNGANVWLTLSVPHKLEPLSCPQEVHGSPPRAAHVPSESPAPPRHAPAILPAPTKLKVLSPGEFLKRFRRLMGLSPNVADVLKVVTQPQRAALLAGLDPKAAALDVLEVGSMIMVEPMAVLPVDPPRSAYARLLLDPAARSRQEVYSRYGVELDLDRARGEVWRELRTLYGPRYYLPLYAPNGGPCVALLSSPALTDGTSLVYTLMPCAAASGPLNEAQALKRLEREGRSPKSDLRLVTFGRTNGPARCDPLASNGPLWTDGVVAVHAFSGHVYAVTPADALWATNPPGAYLQLDEVELDGRPFQILSAFTPLELRPLDCVPPAPPAPRPAAP